MKFYDLKKADKYSEEILRDFYKRLNFKNKDDFNSYLVSYNLNISKQQVHTVSEISEVTINKCYKKLIKLKKELIPPTILKSYSME